MKSKATTYVLILLLLVVWGVILWRILFAADSAPLDQGIENQITRTKKDRSEVSLKLNYRDPFGVIKADSIDANRDKTDHPIEVNRPKMENVLYIGCMKSEGRIYHLLDIMGEKHCLVVGTDGGGVRILASYGDSIKVSKDGREYLLKRME